MKFANLVELISVTNYQAGVVRMLPKLLKSISDHLLPLSTWPACNIFSADPKYQQIPPSGVTQCNLCSGRVSVVALLFQRLLYLTTPLLERTKCWGTSKSPGAGYNIDTYVRMEIFNFSSFSLAILEKMHFCVFLG